MTNNQIDPNINELEGSNLKDYFRLIRMNIIPFILIIIASTLIAIFYAKRLPNIYVSSTSLKISKSGGNILQNPFSSELNAMAMDRFINNEIEILRSYDLRELVAKSLLDSVNESISKDDFNLLYAPVPESGGKKMLSVSQAASLLGGIVGSEQKKGLDIIVISVQSTSPKEATLIATIYANIYRTYNLEINRDQLTYVRKFLDEQRNEKKNQLREAEDTLRSFQEKGGIIALDEQARSLIAQLSDFEAKLNATKIELTASDEVLSKYKDELAKQDPKLADYLQSVTSETYITALQNQISEFQLNKDLALAKFESGIDISEKVKEYDAKIKELKGKLDEKIKIMKSGIFASSPEEVRGLSQKIIEEEVKNKSLASSVSSLNTVVSKYEAKFNKLPKTTIEFAQFQRTRESSVKLFTLIEEKYQEALINEQSQPGNVLIIDNARVPTSPASQIGL